MQMHQEKPEAHSIQAYTTDSITIQGTTYTESVIVSNAQIIQLSSIAKTQDLNLDILNIVLDLHPEIILLGHEQLYQLPPQEWLCPLSKQRIGIECMRMDAACRTFNILLSEQRKVVLIFLKM